MTREQAISELEILKEDYWDDDGYGHETKQYDDTMLALDMAIKALEQEPTSFQWCTDCKEYDQEKHCCHRWSKVIRDTVEEMRQEYIEREVLDKIRAEIEPKCDRINSLASVLPYATHREIQELLCEIMDLCKAESEAEDGNDLL